MVRYCQLKVYVNINRINPSVNRYLTIKQLLINFREESSQIFRSIIFDRRDVYNYFITIPHYD